MSLPALPALLLLACTASDKGGDLPSDSDDSPAVEVEATEAQLEAYYAPHGGPEAFPEHYRSALEALLFGQDDVVLGDFDAARARVDAVFEAMPLSTDTWTEQQTLYGQNVGAPIAYYGLRMLDQLLEAGPQPITETLQMTAVVTPCARVTRPSGPDLSPETVDLELDPQILAEDARVLFQSTDLFRRWAHAITRGSEVELVVHTLSECATVDFSLSGGNIVSYPDTGAMLAAVPEAVSDATDFWWVVAPSGVPGDGSDYEQVFITGGMGRVGAGLPLFISDDQWFLRAPAHLGEGPYDDVERRAYQPQWFQHEFMHHLFALWPELGLEDSSHQWFDRATWPSDFEGRWEPDYYAEAVDKRLLSATPSLAEALSAPEFADMGDLGAEALVGRYERLPVENDWHGVTIELDGEALTWRNDAGVSWSLDVREGALFTGADCPYGVSELAIELEGGEVAALYFSGERYGRVGG